MRTILVTLPPPNGSGIENPGMLAFAVVAFVAICLVAALGGAGSTPRRD